MKNEDFVYKVGSSGRRMSNHVGNIDLAVENVELRTLRDGLMRYFNDPNWTGYLAINLRSAGQCVEFLIQELPPE